LLVLFQVQPVAPDHYRGDDVFNFIGQLLGFFPYFADVHREVIPDELTIQLLRFFDLPGIIRIVVFLDFSQLLEPVVVSAEQAFQVVFQGYAGFARHQEKLQQGKNISRGIVERGSS